MSILRYCGHFSGDPEALASALSKLERAATIVSPSEPSPATASLFIVNPFGAIQSVARWFSTHPSTAERVARLQELSHRQAPRGRIPGRLVGLW